MIRHFSCLCLAFCCSFFVLQPIYSLICDFLWKKNIEIKRKKVNCKQFSFISIEVLRSRNAFLCSLLKKLRLGWKYFYFGFEPNFCCISKKFKMSLLEAWLLHDVLFNVLFQCFRSTLSKLLLRAFKIFRSVLLS